MTDQSLPSIRFGMMVLYARDLDRTLEFYRLLGLDVADAEPERPVSISRLEGLTLIVTTGAVAQRLDPAWRAPEAGYRQIMEFLVDDDAAANAAPVSPRT